MHKRKPKKNKAERRLIDIHSESELLYWSKRLGCSVEKLKHAVSKVGASPVKVFRELEK